MSRSDGEPSTPDKSHRPDACPLHRKRKRTLSGLAESSKCRRQLRDDHASRNAAELTGHIPINAVVPASMDVAIVADMPVMPADANATSGTANLPLYQRAQRRPRRFRERRYSHDRPEGSRGGRSSPGSSLRREPACDHSFSDQRVRPINPSKEVSPNTLLAIRQPCRLQRIHQRLALVTHKSKP
jgi:hypothetical protein